VSVERDQDLRAGLDALQGDMAAHQRAFRGEVTGEANRRLAADTFAELERSGQLEQAEALIAPPPEPEVERTTREVDGRAYQLTKAPDREGAPLRMSRAERDLELKMLQRLQLLLTLRDEGILGAPSWRTRAESVMALMVLPGGVLRFAQELDQLLEDSIKPFGDWKVDPDRRIYVGA
jgi:hypothetical protein